MKKSFASDNNSGVHPDILKAMVSANESHYVSYGDDIYTPVAREIFRKAFGDTAEVFFMLTGTGANVSALQCITDRFHAIICVQTAHIHIDECGAPEHALGTKLLTVPTKNGKLTTADIESFLHYIGDQHHVQPSCVSISQPTELGTLYTIPELKEIVDFAHTHSLKVHLDGARLSNAAVALDCSIKNLTMDVGVDVVSFGGTKNGMMMGEAVVVFDKGLATSLPFIRKQNMQLLSKMRYISAQFIAYLSDSLYLRNARISNEMASLLYRRLREKVPSIVTSPPECNAVFVKIDNQIAQKMQNERFFYTWDEHDGIYRFMTSYDMTEQDIEDFVEFISRHIPLRK